MSKHSKSEVALKYRDAKSVLRMRYEQNRRSVSMWRNFVFTVLLRGRESKQPDSMRKIFLYLEI
jgi:hypothetical protein